MSRKNTIISNTIQAEGITGAVKKLPKLSQTDDDYL